MKLQQIKLSGFKSFVDNTLIDINGQLVGIVVPNGCGKSNVIDAVRWVLGESSAKQLRGESMTDVIFSGSIKRKAISRATVELVFDNVNKSLYGLWNNYDEISIKRLISRQGESIYYINNQQVRKKDITELFLGTGVGTKGYAVIEQGMISKIIESRPEDMRLFVEEAAGISKYRERRKETLQRLGDTQDNLMRLEDIHSEILKQLQHLHEQAKVAQLHQNLNYDLRHQQTLSLAIRILDAEKLLNEANQLITNCEDELRVLGYQLEETNLSLHDEQEKKIGHEQLFHDLTIQFNEYRTDLARVEERFKHYSDLLKRFELESNGLIGREAEINLDLEELDIQITTQQEQIEENQFQLENINLEHEAQSSIVDDLQLIYDDAAKVVSERQNRLNSFRYDLALLENSLTHKRQQQHKLIERLNKLESDKHGFDFDENYHFIKDEINLVNEELTHSEIIYEEKSVQLEQYKLVESRLQQEYNEVQQNYAASQAKIQTLEQMLISQSNHNNDQVIFNQTDLREIWQDLNVANGFELVIEIALGNLLHAKQLNSISNIINLPTNLQSIWLGSETVKHMVDSDSLSSLVEVKNPALSGIYYYLNNYILLDNIADYNKLPAGKYGVSLDGHLATKDYIIYNVNSESDSLFQQYNQLEIENTTFEQLTEKLASLSDKLHDTQRVIQQISQDIASLSAKHKRLQTKQHELQLEFTKQEQIYLQNQRHHERVTQDSLLLSQEIAHQADEIENLSIQLEEKNIQLEDLDTASQLVESHKLESETSLQSAKNKLQDIERKINKYLVDNQLLNQQNRHALNLITEKKLQLATARQKLAELSNERTEFNSNDQAQEIIQLQEKIAEIALQMQTEQQQIDELAVKITTLKNKASSLNSNYQRNLEKINQAKFKQQEQNILLSTYRENIATLNLTDEQITTLVAQNNLGLDELQRNCKNLESQIAALGLVNLKAIDDLADANANEQELLKQIDDLTQATATLQTAIEQIDNESRKLLQKTFDQLNEAIVVYFRMLFGGGNARLALTDKDILNAGIQIFAEPPGKKNSTIHLLSGGEKALAAMSFIFALFSLNPAPFCLLDEVDAPLDDANTQRFCNLVQELSNKTQFVYISHNRLAMEMADQLVGVTMQEKGVSTIVSVSLVDAIQHSIDVN